MSPLGDSEERIVSVMKQLGFTASDARAYLALLKKHPATGYELAASSGVPRSAIYNVLRRLEGLGLVNAMQSKPAKYQPLPPKRLFELLSSRFDRTLDDLKDSLSNMSAPSADLTTWTVHGYSAMLEQARSLISSAKKTVHTSLWVREALKLSSPFEEATSRGVDTFLFSFNELPEKFGRCFGYGIAAEKLEEHWQHKIILIADNERALIGGAENIQENRCVVTEELMLIEMAMSNLVLDITLYGQRFNVDVSDVVTGLTAHLAPIDHLIPK